MSAITDTSFFTASAIDDPHSLYDQMRALAPVCQIGETRAFVACSHSAVTELVKRHQDFSANLRGMLVCGDDHLPTIFDLKGAGTASDVIATADEPDHAIHRRLMLPPLKAGRILALEKDISRFAQKQVHDFLSTGGDACSSLCEALPAYVVTRLLGLGDDAQEAVQRWAMMGGEFLAGRFESHRLQFILQETAAQNTYLTKHFETVKNAPPSERGESLTATLAQGVDDQLISKEQAVGILTILFGAAGESTASLIGSAILRLAQDQPLQQRLRAEPELIPAFIEEILRLEPPFKFHYRSVNADTTLAGTPLRAGDLVLACWAAANRDPEVWPAPHQLLLDRPHKEKHFGFGYGIHFCIGAPLAKLETRVLLESLLRKTDDFSLSGINSFRYAPSIFVRRLESLRLSVSRKEN